jgi:hypothetical protein
MATIQHPASNASPLVVPPNWHLVDLGSLAPKRLLEAMSYIITNEMAKGALYGEFNLLARVMGKDHLPLSLRWEMCRDSLQKLNTDMEEDFDMRAMFGVVEYSGEFAFYSVDNAMQFKMKFT